VNVIRQLWQGLGKTARIGLVAGAAAIVVATGLAIWWMARPDYQVLFGGLSAQDAAAMTAELEREKIAYRLEEQGPERSTVILVDATDVYRTRLKVMGKDLPLRGAVGFELFNNSDFGMTEFAQRINYQRALQGELTRTILSLSEIRDARVLLAMPEQGLFRREREKATASVSLALKPDRSLSPAQVNGIQRLVAAAVPGIAAPDVTIVDESGVALSRPAGEGESDAGAGRLDLKRETEAYLARKALEVLERTLGRGQALTSVDVTLDMDRVQTTTENVVAAPGGPGRTPTGVVVRERETVRELGTPLSSGSGSGSSSGTASGSSQREVEYAVGRRVEQVVGQVGSIRRLHVVAVVKGPLDPERKEQLRTLVAASVGAVPDRGDAVVVQSMEAMSPAAAPPQAPSRVAGAGDHGAGEAVGSLAGAESSSAAPANVGPAAIGAGLLVACVFAAGLAAVAARKRRRPRGPAAVVSLSDVERRAALTQVHAWLRTGEDRRPTGGGR
jgi:flagellar M-ring protein FliF